jgi:hypothetical protein
MKRKSEDEEITISKRVKIHDDGSYSEEEEYYTIESFIREYILKSRKKKELKNKKNITKSNDKEI